jgi:hypothetical protein
MGAASFLHEAAWHTQNCHFQNIVKIISDVEFEVLDAVSMKMAVF